MADNDKYIHLDRDEGKFIRAIIEQAASIAAIHDEMRTLEDIGAICHPDYIFHAAALVNELTALSTMVREAKLKLAAMSN